MRELYVDKRLIASILALLSAALILLAITVPGAARAGLTVPTLPTKPDLSKVVPLARVELSKQVTERRSNNIPRYRNGKGRIAPYSIGAPWCMAFATWVWEQAGIRSYLDASLLRRSFDHSLVAVQVRDMTSWAKRNNYWSYRAKPGYLVLYGRSHTGIVERIDREGRAIGSIEGNKSDRVQRVKVDMSQVTGYISPWPIVFGQLIPKTSSLADVD